MPKYAVIQDNVVVNALVAPSLSSAEKLTGKTCIEITDELLIGPGYFYDNEKGKWVHPIELKEQAREVVDEV